MCLARRSTLILRTPTPRDPQCAVSVNIYNGTPISGANFTKIKKRGYLAGVLKKNNTSATPNNT